MAANRGLTTKKKLEDFLNPKLDQILSVDLGKTRKAIERIKKAIVAGEKVVVYSDYDADGICATAIVWETLYDLGVNILPYVPHRVKEGYGLSIEAIEKLAKDKVSLIITVDHGVTATKQVKRAKELGVDVIITDHHLLPKELPKAYALVHTTNLCGAGVAWKFCWEIIKEIKPSHESKLLDKLELAALATIADLVPLIGASRAIVKLGLEKLATSKRAGIKALIKVSGITSSIGTYEIGHVLAPRINAMGRIDHALDSLRLLCIKNQEKADELAQALTQTNIKRRDLTDSAIEAAREMVKGDQLVGVIVHDSWHEGIIGLVASRLVEKFHRPMIVIARGQTLSKGSARSIPGFNIVEAIRTSSEFLLDGGGHPMAAGFTIRSEYIEAFTKKINTFAQTKITDEILQKVINIECELEKSQINKDTFKIVKQFEPFGIGNPEPVFLTKNMLVEDIRIVGARVGHLKMQLEGISAIGFGMGQSRVQLRPGYNLDVVYTLAEDKFNGRDKIQMKIKDFKISGS